MAEERTAIEQYYARTGVRPGDGSYDPNNDGGSSRDDQEEEFDRDDPQRDGSSAREAAIDDDDEEEETTTQPSYSRDPSDMIDRDDSSSTPNDEGSSGVSDRPTPDELEDAAEDTSSADTDTSTSSDPSRDTSVSDRPTPNEVEEAADRSEEETSGSQPSSEDGSDDVDTQPTGGGANESTGSTSPTSTTSPGTGGSSRSDSGQAPSDGGGASTQADADRDTGSTPTQDQTDGRTAMEEWYDREDTPDDPTDRDQTSSDTPASSTSSAAGGTAGDVGESLDLGEFDATRAVEFDAEEPSDAQMRTISNRAQEQAGPGEEIAIASDPSGGTTAFVGEDAIEAANQANRLAVESDLEQQVGRDLEPGEQFTFDETGDGISAQLTDQFEREQARSQFEQEFESELGQDVPSDEIVLEETGDGFEGRLSEAFQQEQARSQFEEEFEGELGQDVPADEVVVEETDDGYRGRLSEGFQSELAEGFEQGQRPVDPMTGSINDDFAGQSDPVGQPALTSGSQSDEAIEQRFRSQVERNLEERAGRDLEPGAEFDVSVGEETDQRERPTSSEFEQIAGSGGNGEIGATVRLSDGLRQDLSDREFDATGGVLNAGQRPTGGRNSGPDSDVFSVAAGEFESAAGVNLPGEGSAVNAAEEDAPTGEVFGGSSGVEEQLRSAGNAFEQDVVAPSSEIAGDIAASEVGALASIASPAEAGRTALRAQQQAPEAAADIQDAIEEADSQSDVEYAVRQEIGQVIDVNTPDQQRRSAASGVAEGLGDAANLPRYAVAGIEAGEVVGEVGSATGTGLLVNQLAASQGVESQQDPEDVREIFGGERAAEVTGRSLVGAAGTARGAVENPARTGGQAVGGLIAGAVGPSLAFRSVRSVRSTEIDVDQRARDLPNESPDPLRTEDVVEPETGLIDELGDVERPGTVQPSQTDLPTERPQTLRPNDVDSATGATGPSGTARARGFFEREISGEQVTDVPQFRTEQTSAQLGVVRSRDSPNGGRGGQQFDEFGGGGGPPRDPNPGEFDLELSQRRLERAARREAQADETVRGQANFRERAGGGSRGRLDPDRDAISQRRRDAETEDTAATGGGLSRLREAQRPSVRPADTIRPGAGIAGALFGDNEAADRAAAATSPSTGRDSTGAELSFDPVPIEGSRDRGIGGERGDAGVDTGFGPISENRSGLDTGGAIWSDRDNDVSATAALDTRTALEFDQPGTTTSGGGGGSGTVTREENPPRPSRSGIRGRGATVSLPEADPSNSPTQTESLFGDFERVEFENAIAGVGDVAGFGGGTGADFGDFGGDGSDNEFDPTGGLF